MKNLILNLKGFPITKLEANNVDNWLHNTRIVAGEYNTLEEASFLQILSGEFAFFHGECLINPIEDTEDGRFITAYGVYEANKTLEKTVIERTKIQSGPIRFFVFKSGNLLFLWPLYFLINPTFDFAAFSVEVKNVKEIIPEKNRKDVTLSNIANNFSFIKNDNVIFKIGDNFCVSVK